jgi:formylglycine-generating enzyme required for sulfatase activity
MNRWKAGRRLWGVLALAVAAASVGVAGYRCIDGPAPLTLGDGRTGPKDMVWIPGGAFTMGSEHPHALPNEGPAHRVKLSGFWVDRYDVTNAQFARFVAATGYVTTAERKPQWADLKTQLLPGTPRPDDRALVPGGLVFTGTDAPVPLNDYSRWWTFMPGANWRHPEGPSSSIAGKDNHPVVQVSYEDALAYAKWAHKRLLTEAEWEYAARGGLEQADYAWGAELSPGRKQMANVWDNGTGNGVNGVARPFPVTALRGTAEKVHVGTTAVGAYAPNGYGLYDMAGNVWQWVADWYRADAFRIEAASGQAVNDPAGPASSFDPDRGPVAHAPERVTRGGSFLCSETYCMSYRTSARRGTDPMNSMSHLGFRLAMDENEWKR